MPGILDLRHQTSLQLLTDLLWVAKMVGNTAQNRSASDQCHTEYGPISHNRSDIHISKVDACCQLTIWHRLMLYTKCSGSSYILHYLHGNRPPWISFMSKEVTRIRKSPKTEKSNPRGTISLYIGKRLRDHHIKVQSAHNDGWWERLVDDVILQ